MAYEKQIWEDLPSESTPINADRLGHMEQGIYDANQLVTTSTPGQMSAEDKTKLNILNEPEISGETLII